MDISHTLPELPYPLDALEPYISKETLEYHYGKHHSSYIKKLNQKIKGTRYEELPLEQLVSVADGEIFNNAAQAWNHAFYWRCMKPGGAQLKGELAEAIKQSFTSIDSFESDFATAATGHFGSGWCWLVVDEKDKLAITTTHDADTPVRHNQIPLLTCDVWEHAYYIDYRNDRPEYLNNFWHVVNWDFVSEQFQDARHRKAA
jgi:Fe-Mn family superoxide dismutase